MSRIIRAAVRHSNDRYSAPDPVAVAESIYGRRPRLRSAEMREVVSLLTARGWSALRIAEHVGTTNRTVFRHRAQLREVRG